ncbi:gamma-glutamyl hydrolase A [Galendromus occidentalis]|uniref:folate gamma-glutamyl hydrolase n=1 Tax=Galendromus occidentalis TaxID=34638 RepID=A0AAJ7L5Q8_9ACAR|nr:gamma-glutamyl hydrolase A [Galendromus occidentalis]
MFSGRCFRILAVVFSFVVTVRPASVANNRPVVGIVAEDYYGRIPGKSTYIAASYVKWAEAAGARVLPIFINQTEEYYDRVLGLVNGVIFPGGAVHIDKDTGYGNSGRLIYKKIHQRNLDGYLPLWGTCLGMELVIYAHLNRNDPRTRCAMQDKALSLQLGETHGRLLGSAPENIIQKLTTEPVNIHYHSWCLTSKNFRAFNLDSDFSALAFNNDSEGRKFVSVLEHKYMPIYLTQFHPEKPQFEWVDNLKHHNIPHSSSAIAVGQFFANFFIDECRKNKAQFPAENNGELIYAYPVSNTGAISIYEQSYLFD